MKKIKNSIFICLILVFSIVLIIIPKLVNQENKDNVSINESQENYIILTINGEITKNELVLELPKGITYGYLIQKITPYLNEYSIINEDYCKVYNQSATITIATLDEGNNSKANEENDNESNKLKITTASYEELLTLYGIGDKRANKIITYLKENELSSFDELQKLIGVSDEIIAKIKEQAVL